MNCPNTRYQMRGNGWETWGGGVSWPYPPSPLPRSLRSRWVPSVPEAWHVRDSVSGNGRALILVVRQERETYTATCQRQSFSFVIWNVSVTFFSFQFDVLLGSWPWIYTPCRQFPRSCGRLFIAVLLWPALSETQHHPSLQSQWCGNV